jgi:pimeloyl-ACP methyl ester carboxylesterase
MYVTVNGARLFFDVDGAKFVPDGARMRERPTVVLLHGGPGGDHATFKPRFDGLTDVAQLVYLDHRGNGRSAYGDPAGWNLDQWGDDIRAFCDVLGIERPIVLGYSFGGIVAQAYATRHVGHAGKLILYSTTPKVDRQETFAVFERLGGARARAVAEQHLTRPDAQSRIDYTEICGPLYNRRGAKDPDATERSVRHDAVSEHWFGPGGQSTRFDFRNGLGRVQCPTLVMAGEDDPITPISRSELIARCLPPHLVRFERFENAGHGVHIDDPAGAFAVLRDFILSDG